MVETQEKTRYDELVSLGDDLKRLVKLGFISCHIMNWKQYYESYMIELQTNDKSVAVTHIADKNKISERQVYKIIKYMKTTD